MLKSDPATGGGETSETRTFGECLSEATYFDSVEDPDGTQSADYQPYLEARDDKDEPALGVLMKEVSSACYF